MTETTEEGRTGEVVTAEATGWQHRNSLLAAAAAEDRSDVFACLQRVDVAVMLIQRTSCTTARVVVSERRGQFEIATLPVGLLLSDSSAYFIGKCYFETPAVHFSSRHSERNNSPTCEFPKIFHNEYHQSQSFYITEVSRKMVLSDGDTKSLAKFYIKKKKSQLKKKNHNVSPYRCCGVVQASGRLDRIQLGASFAKIPAAAFRNWGHSHAS